MRYCGVENVEKVAMEAYKDMKNGHYHQQNEAPPHGFHQHHKGHHRRASKSKNVVTSSSSPSHSTSSHEPATWKAAIFKVRFILRGSLYGGGGELLGQSFNILAVFSEGRG